MKYVLTKKEDEQIAIIPKITQKSTANFLTSELAPCRPTRRHKPNEKYEKI